MARAGRGAGVERWWSAGYVAALALFIASYFAREPYDDSYFFKRIALNALDHGTWAWNVDEGPVYGSTSQTMQALALLVTAISRNHYMLLTRALAALTLAVAFVVISRLTRAKDDGLSGLLAFCAPALLFPAITGMETALSLLAMCGFLAVLYSERGRARHWTIAPLLVVWIYLTRPDAALLAAVPLLLERHARERRWPVRETALVVCGIGAWLVLFRLYYGTALPLPFYAKQAVFSPYDAHFIQLGKVSGRQRFGVFAVGTASLFLAALRRRDRTNCILLGTTGAFVAYHLIFTIDVMGMQGRFYAPAAPLLVLACARAAEREGDGRGVQDDVHGEHFVGLFSAFVIVAGFVALLLLHGLPIPSGFALDDVPTILYALAVGGGAALVYCLQRPARRRVLGSAVLLLAIVGSLARIRRQDLHFYSDDEYLALHTSRYTVYRGLDTLRACFGDRLHVYHSEVGVPGLRFQAGKVTDLAGLLSPAWLFRLSDFDSACHADAPEAIFLPHKNYVDLNRRIRASHCLEGYERMVDASSSPLYVRRDLAARFHECAVERRDPFVTAARSALAP